MLILFLVSIIKKFSYSLSELEESFRTPYFVIFTNYGGNKGQYRDVWNTTTQKYINDERVIFSTIKCAAVDDFCSKLNIKVFPTLTVVQRGCPKAINPNDLNAFENMIQDEINSEKSQCRFYPEDFVGYPAIIYGSNKADKSQACDEFTELLDNVQEPYKYGYVQPNNKTLSYAVNKKKEFLFTENRAKPEMQKFILEYSKKQLTDYSFNSSKSSSRRVIYIIYHPDNLTSLNELGSAVNDASAEVFVPLMDVNEYNLLFAANYLANTDVPAILMLSKDMTKYSIRTRFMDDNPNFLKFLEGYASGDYDREMIDYVNPPTPKTDYNTRYRLIVSLLCVVIVISFIVTIIKGFLCKSDISKIE